MFHQKCNRDFRIVDRAPADKPSVVLKVVWPVLGSAFLWQAGDLSGPCFPSNREASEGSRSSFGSVHDQFQPLDNYCETLGVEGDDFSHWGRLGRNEMRLNQISSVCQNGKGSR